MKKRLERSRPKKKQKGNRNSINLDGQTLRILGDYFSKIDTEIMVCLDFLLS